MILFFMLVRFFVHFFHVSFQFSGSSHFPNRHKNSKKHNERNFPVHVFTKKINDNARQKPVNDESSKDVSNEFFCFRIHIITNELFQFLVILMSIVVSFGFNIHFFVESCLQIDAGLVG